MKWACPALVAAVISSAGCSAFVASRGEDLNALTTKEQVRRTFGTPVTSGGDDRPYDEFRTHRKISERWRGEYLLIPCVVTGGLSEIVLLPQELFVAARQYVVGHNLRFEYDADGNVVAVLLDGESPFWLRRQTPQKSDSPNGNVPTPGNALGSLAENKFDSWTISPRLDLPLGFQNR